MTKITINEPQRMIIFGATGDLAKLKLFPAIFELYQQKRLSSDFKIYGYGRKTFSDQQFQDHVLESLKDTEDHSEIKKDFVKNFLYVSGAYDKQEDYLNLADRFISEGYRPGMVITAYFSVPPTVFESISINLAKAFPDNLSRVRLVIEKPFGLNEAGAAHLHRVVTENFPEKNIFLLDHYLGKRSIQSILKLRLENSIINLLLRGNEISSIRIIAHEKADVGQRIGYYDQVGALKDMIQSHLLQILALISMDIPLLPTVESLQREKQNILSAIRFSGESSDLILGQYQGYRDSDPAVSASFTETFAAIKLFIDRRDWFNVPIILATGKKMSENSTKIIIDFKRMPFQSSAIPSNQLIFESKPDERIKITLSQPSDEQFSFAPTTIQAVELDQSIACGIDGCLGDYASLLLDVMSDRKVYFISYPEIISAWKLIDYICAVKAKKAMRPMIYQNGGAEMENLLKNIL